jgi:hypothetical protein
MRARKAQPCFAFFGTGPKLVPHLGKAKAFEIGLHRRVVAGIDPGRAVALCPVPGVDLAQFGGEYLGRRDLLQGRVALAVVDNQRSGRVGPSPEILGILRRIEQRPAFGVAAKPAVVKVAVGGRENASDLHATALNRADHCTIAILDATSLEARLAERPPFAAGIRVGFSMPMKVPISSMAERPTNVFASVRAPDIQPEISATSTHKNS